MSVKRIGKDTIEEIDKRDGKLITENRMTVNSDGKTMKIVWVDKSHEMKGEVVAEKQ